MKPDRELDDVRILSCNVGHAVDQTEALGQVGEIVVMTMTLAVGVHEIAPANLGQGLIDLCSLTKLGPTPEQCCFGDHPVRIVVAPRWPGLREHGASESLALHTAKGSAMSQQSQGPGYWQASDGLWYPPESKPGAATQPTASAISGSYPARLTVSDDNKVANWRALVHWVMVIPHIVIMYILGLIAAVVAVVSWFVVLFTGQLPEGIHGLQSMYLRYQNRVYGFILLLTEEYPPFDFETTAADSSGYPVRSDFPYSGGPRNRLTTFFRLIMIIPHMIVLYFVNIAAVIAYIVGWFAVLFTGHMPEGVRKFLIGVMRWYTRYSAYFLLLTDEYPPFSTD